MLSTLIALSSLTLAQASGGQGESVFPKPEARNPEVLRDRSIFQYLPEMLPSGQLGWAGIQEEDWSALKYVAPKATAVKLRVLLLVFERDFTDPAISNTLELTDKQRLIASMSRIRAVFSSGSEGELDIEVIPRFIPEPIFKFEEGNAIVEKEFNQFKFDADDREERGPFAATVVVTSSEQLQKVDGYEWESFSTLGGSNPGYRLEQQLVGSISRKLGDTLRSRFALRGKPNPLVGTSMWPTPQANFNLRLLDRGYRADTTDAVNGINDTQAAAQNRIQVQSSIWGPVEVKKEGDALVLTESSILRSGGFTLPLPPQGILEFKVRTKSSNLIGVNIVSGTGFDTLSKNMELSRTLGAGGNLPLTPDGTWQTIRLENSNSKPNPGFTSIVSIGCPEQLQGTTRNPHEIIRYEFKDFRVTTEAPTKIVPDPRISPQDDAEFEKVLVSGNSTIQRYLLAAILRDPSKYKFLQPKLLEMSTELEPAVAFGAVQAYGKIGIASDDLIGKAFMNRLVATAPNEYAREAALLYFAEHPEQTTFEAIAPNIVRRSWRTRIATVKALAALDRTDLKAKPAARQLLLTATGQDMAIIRSAALAAMKPDVEQERKQLEYSLVNDPSEQVRLQCLRQLAAANAPKEVLFGSLADDSPYVREHVYEQLPLSLRREALQRMVIDRDTYVRAAALYGFAKLPEATQAGEIQNTFVEEHPAVLLALVDGANKGKWKLPATVVETALKSKSPLVREGAAKLATK